MCVYISCIMYLHVVVGVWKVCGGCVCVSVCMCMCMVADINLEGVFGVCVST